MANEELHRYIQQELDKKFSREQITQMLITHGYAESDINAGFDEIKQSAPVNEKQTPPERPHKRSFVTIALIIIFVIAGSYVIILAVSGSDRDTPEQVTPVNTTYSDIGSRTMSAAEREQFIEDSVDTCTRILRNYTDDTCAALATGDESRCSGDRECLDTYLLYSSVATGAARCAEIQDKILQGTCTILTGQESCERYTGDDAVFCRAVVGRQPQSCTSIRDVTTERDCVDAIAILTALDAKDATLCEGIRTDLDLADRCVGLLSKNESVCALHSFCEDDAYTDAAMLTADSTLCSHIRDTDKLQKCLKKLS
jgi:hypothetical protein